MQKYIKPDLLKILFLSFILTLLALFLSQSNSYSCDGTPATCTPAKTQCYSDASTTKSRCETDKHDNWDPIPCKKFFCSKYVDSNGDILASCSAPIQDCHQVCADVYDENGNYLGYQCTYVCTYVPNPCLQEAQACFDSNLPFCAGMLSGGLQQCGTDYNTNIGICNSNYEACVIPCVTVTATVDPATPFGSINPSGQVKVQPGNTQSFNINPNDCYHIQSVTGCNGTMNWNTNTYTTEKLYADCTVTASFAINTYTLAATAGTGGAIAPTSTTVTCGSSQTFTITPNSCYHIDDLKDNNVSKKSQIINNQYKLDNIRENHALSATFSNTYRVNVTKAGLNSGATGTGTVTSNPPGIFCDINSTNCGTSFLQDCPSAPSTVTLFATPDVNSFLTTWEGDCSGQGDCQLTMNGDKQVKATFNILPPTAAFSASPTIGYIPSQAVNFTNLSQRPWPAWLNTPPYTYAWNFGDGRNIINEIHQENPTHVYKTVGTYTASLLVTNPSGTSIYEQTITINPCPNLPVRVLRPDNTVFGYYTTVQDAYNAAIGGDAIQALDIYLVGDLNADSPKAVTLTGGYNCNYDTQVGTTSLQGSIAVNDGMLTAGDFALVSGPTDSIYQIVATAGAGGSISPAGTVTIAQGSTQTFTIIPNPNYFILDVLVDGTSAGIVSAYTFTNVTTNHTIAASFSTTYTINASAGSNGVISPVGPTTVVANHDQAFSITPATGYHVADVLVDGVSVGAVTSYTFANVTADHTIAVSFAINTYTINATSGLGGSISPSGAVSVTYGASQTFTMTPDTANGFLLLDVLIDGGSAGLVSSYTFTNVTAAHTIRAIYSSTLTINKVGSGTGLVTSATGSINCGPTCSAEYMQGSTVTLTATPDANSLFIGWAGGGCSGTSDCLVTLNTDTNVTATFNLKPPVVDFSGTPTTAVQSVTVTFTDLSTLNPTSWLWDFGDSLSSSPTSTLKNPIHIYSTVGTYNVQLTATNAGGSSTIVKTAYIVVQPYVKIAGSPTVYHNIQEAYNAAPDGATIQVRDLTLIEDFNANATTPKTITLEGGYDTTFTTAAGVTTLKGSITTTTGKTTIKNFILQK